MSVWEASCARSWASKCFHAGGIVFSGCHQGANREIGVPGGFASGFRVSPKGHATDAEQHHDETHKKGRAYAMKNLKARAM